MILKGLYYQLEQRRFAAYSKGALQYATKVFCNTQQRRFANDCKNNNVNQEIVIKYSIK